MGNPAIFNGQFVKLLKDQLKLKDTARILTGTNDPTSVATEAEKGSLYLRVGGSGGTAYLKQDAGTTTNWTLIQTAASTFTADDILVNMDGDVVTNGTNVLVTG
jgi:hypothetical protein